MSPFPKKHILFYTLFSCCIQGSLAMNTNEEPVVLFDLTSPDSIQDWFVVNDTVMGGVSASSIKLASNNVAIFRGNLSLENNGGFASVRSKPKTFGLDDETHIVARVLGDGKTYRISIRPDQRWDGVSYYYDFETQVRKWMEVHAPLDKFVPRWRGRLVPNAPVLTAKMVQSVGFMIADYQEGAFELRIDTIKAAKNPLNHSLSKSE